MFVVGFEIFASVIIILSFDRLLSLKENAHIHTGGGGQIGLDLFS